MAEDADHTASPTLVVMLIVSAELRHQPPAGPLDRRCEEAANGDLKVSIFGVGRCGDLRRHVFAV
jgi:hypothetical protein